MLKKNLIISTFYHLYTGLNITMQKNISSDSGMNSQYLKLEKYAERN